LLAGAWCLSAVVFSYVYNGSLVSFLSVPQMNNVVDSLEQLVASQLAFGCRKSSSTEGLFQVVHANTVVSMLTLKSLGFCFFLFGLEGSDRGSLLGRRPAIEAAAELVDGNR